MDVRLDDISYAADHCINSLHRNAKLNKCGNDAVDTEVHRSIDSANNRLHRHDERATSASCARISWHPAL